jgi:hypothetical protein
MAPSSLCTQNVLAFFLFSGLTHPSFLSTLPLIYLVPSPQTFPTLHLPLLSFTLVRFRACGCLYTLVLSSPQLYFFVAASTPLAFFSSLRPCIVIYFHLAHDSPSMLDAHRLYFSSYSLYFSFYLAPHTLAFLPFNLLLPCRLSISPTSCAAPRFSFYVAPCLASSFLLTPSWFIWLLAFFWVCFLSALCSSSWFLDCVLLCVSMVLPIPAHLHRYGCSNSLLPTSSPSRCHSPTITRSSE